MDIKTRLVYLTLVFSLAAAATLPADTADEAAKADPVTAALSGETRALLIREMQAIDAAMGHVHRALVTGDHGTVVDQARSIHDSFVLAQEMSDAQRHEIHSRLPADFLQKDQAFHALAGRLVEAGRHADARLQRLWFGEMTRACQECHAQHAGARFPGLKESAGGTRP
ncbi:MAG: hypothetical protein RQ826_03585 [Xanthomonadales bacterium]|nr:hypothetical protein [Xanthomonadales bacterium]